jgi:hypothetical protein
MQCALRCRGAHTTTGRYYRSLWFEGTSMGERQECMHVVTTCAASSPSGVYVTVSTACIPARQNHALLCHAQQDTVPAHACSNLINSHGSWMVGCTGTAAQHLHHVFKDVAGMHLYWHHHNGPCIIFQADTFAGSNLLAPLIQHSMF